MTNDPGENLEERVLVVAPVGKDAHLISDALGRAGIAATPCRTLGDLCVELEVGAGAVFLMEEAFDGRTETLLAAIDGQPSWSDLPIIVCYGKVNQPSRAFSEAIVCLESRANLTLLERPMNPRLLLNAARSALRARRRQYERRRFQEERQSLLDELVAAKEASEVANRAKSAFLANMSHEIRTPLGAMTGFAELLSDPGASADERAQAIETIIRSGDQLTKVINDILDLSKVESGQLDVERIEFPLDELLNDVTAVFQAKARQKGLALVVTKDGPIPPTIRSDPTRLRQILLNIVGNAIKFTEQGTVAIRVATAATGGDGETTLRFEVSDTGIGLSAEQVAKLFQPFVQADVSHARRYGGTGLGLALSRQLAERLGGRLEIVATALGTGSTFRVTVDAGIDGSGAGGPGSAAAASMAGVARFPQTDSVSLAGASVLVVDDTADNRLLVGRFLKKLGADVVTASGGMEAVAVALSRAVDLVFMDIQMPDMDGFRATQSLREHGFGRPIVAVTAHAMRGDRESCLAAGFDEYVSKPLTLRALTDVVARLSQQT